MFKIIFVDFDEFVSGRYVLFISISLNQS